MRSKRVLRDGTGLAQIMKLDVLQDSACLQSLIDLAGIRAVDEWPARIQSVAHPILVPAGRGLDKLLNIAGGRSIKSFDFQAAIDTNIDVRLDHRNIRRRLFGR